MQKKNPPGKTAGSGSEGESPPTERHDRSKDDQSQAEPRRLLIGNLARNWEAFRCCKYAQTMTAYSQALKTTVIIALECKRWGCDCCGRKRTLSLAQKVAHAKPNRLITLTCWSKAYESPRLAYDATRGAVTQLAVRVRRKYGNFEYLRVLEQHKNGYPHYHLVVRSGYVPQKFLSQVWAELTKSKIVDVRLIKKQEGAFRYVMKYLAKQSYIPWTNRRVSWSRKFFQKDDWKPPSTLGLIEKEWHQMHPADWFSKMNKEATVEEMSSTCWIEEDQYASVWKLVDQEGPSFFGKAKESGDESPKGSL